MGPTRGFSTCFSAVRGEEPGGELRAPRSRVWERDSRTCCGNSVTWILKRDDSSQRGGKTNKKRCIKIENIRGAFKRAVPERSCSMGGGGVPVIVRWVPLGPAQSRSLAGDSPPFSHGRSHHDERVRAE